MGRHKPCATLGVQTEWRTIINPSRSFRISFQNGGYSAKAAPEEIHESVRFQPGSRHALKRCSKFVQWACNSFQGLIYVRIDHRRLKAAMAQE